MNAKLDELRKLSKEELWRFYDKAARGIPASLDYYRGEIIRREQKKQTVILSWLTVFMAIAAIFSIIGVFVD